MAGGAAAVLIGLVSVVISLMQDRSRDSVLAGSKPYMGPIVLGVSFIFSLSAAALIPGISGLSFGRRRRHRRGVGLRARDDVVRRHRPAEGLHWTDVWFYGVFPSAAYVAVGAVAIAFWQEWSWARDGLAVVITLGLLLAIRNEWDLITWITPRHEGGDLE